MGRRTRMRHVKRTPENFYFNELDLASEEYVELTIAEFEAMRLKHYAQLKQKDCSEKMNISQPTFSRILDNAHQKVTAAIIEGKKIRIAGGNVQIKKGFVGYGCMNCDNEWEDPNATKTRSAPCPKCDSKKVYYLEKEPI